MHGLGGIGDAAFLDDFHDILRVLQVKSHSLLLLYRLGWIISPCSKKALLGLCFCLVPAGEMHLI